MDDRRRRRAAQAGGDDPRSLSLGRAHRSGRGARAPGPGRNRPKLRLRRDGGRGDADGPAARGLRRHPRPAAPHGAQHHGHARGLEPRGHARVANVVAGREMSMQVYAFDLMPWPHLAEASYYPDSNGLYDPVLGRTVYDEHLRQMELYEECGYDAICINEHHAKPYGLMPSPNLVAAALTQRTKNIKIGIFGNLPALHANPLRLAEEVAMLDVMSGGRIISGFVRGVPQEFLAYTVPIAEARPRMQEAWDLIVKAWTEREPFDWHGRYFHYEHVVIWPRPLQQPYPPIVMPADSDEGLEIAARRRVPTGTAYRSLRHGKAVLEKFRALAAAQGWTPTPEHCLMVRHIYVAESNERARREAEPHLDYFWRKLLSYHKGSMALMGQSPAPRPAVVQ